MNSGMKGIIGETEDEIRRQRGRTPRPEDVRWKEYIAECAKADGWDFVRKTLLEAAAESLLLIEAGDLRAAQEAKNAEGTDEGEGTGG